MITTTSQRIFKRAILICGGRDFTDKSLLDATLSELFETFNPSETLVIVGDANGADALAAQWALKNWYSISRHYADWDAHGRSAGPKRNSEMVAELMQYEDRRCIAFPGGTGTADTVSKCKQRNVKVKQIKGSKR